MTIAKTTQRSIFRVLAFLFFALVIPDLLAASFTNVPLPLALAFGCLSYASAKDAHLFPVDAQEAAATPLAKEQRNYGLLSISFAALGGLIWYITDFTEIL